MAGAKSLHTLLQDVSAETEQNPDLTPLDLDDLHFGNPALKNCKPHSETYRSATRADELQEIATEKIRRQGTPRWFFPSSIERTAQSAF